jgi:hypothetical protein
VRGGHRRAAHRRVAVVDRLAQIAVAAPGSHDADTRSGEVGHQRTVAHAGTPRREVRDLVGVIDRPDRERSGRAGRGAHRRRGRTVVAGRDHEQRPGLGGEVVDRRFERIDPGGVGCAEAEVDHPGARVDRPLHPGDDRGLGTVEDPAHLAVEQHRVGGHALVPAARCRSRPGDRRRHMRAVPDLVDAVGLVGEVRPISHLVDQVGMVGVDARVEHRHRHTLAGETGLPRLGRTDLRHRHVQAGRALAVEPDRAGPVLVRGSPLVNSIRALDEL